MKEHYSKSIITRQSHEKIERTINRFKASKDKTSTLLLHLEKHAPRIVKPTVQEAVNSCGSWLEFRHYLQSDKTKLHNANFCKQDKLCPACAMRRASKQVQKVHQYLQANPDLLKKHWYYIVLPVQHTKEEDFSTVYNRLRSALDKLKKNLQNKRIGQKNKKSFFTQFEGVLYSIEVTKTKNGWNIHANLMALSSSKIEGIYKKGKTYVHDGIMQDWAKYTDNNSYVHSINELDMSTDETLIKNLLEVFKYSLKFQDLSPDDLIEVYKSTYRKRLLGGFGSLYGLKIDVQFQDEAIDEEYLEIIYRYNYNCRNYYRYRTQLKESDFSSSVRKVEANEEETKRGLQKRAALIKKQLPPKHVKIEVLSSDGSVEMEYTKTNHKGFNDFEIFSKTMSKSLTKLQQKKPRRV